MPVSPFQALDRFAARFRAALVDPARTERAVLVSLAVYVLLWTAYGSISKAPQGLHPDMTEIVNWSRDLALGYLKHPPLAAWIAAAWFAVLPVAEWSYYLLAMLMPALALWIAWQLSADYLDLEKRVLGLALITFVPFFNFHALKYNVNTVLMPLWAATTFAFLRAYRTRTPLWAVLAGLAAAASMLGKYWSIFLLVGLALAALIDKRRMAYFRSSAPWITIAVGLLALTPHVAWLVQNDFAPFGYAVAIHGEKPFGAVAFSTLGYIGGSLGYVAVPLLVTLVLARPNGAVLADMAWPAETERRLAALAFWLPFLLPVAGALAGRSEITSLWSMPAFTLLPVLLLSAPQVAVRPVDTRRVLVAAVAFPLVMLIASPAIGYIAQRNNPAPESAHASLLARQVEELWRQATPRPLRYVVGDADLAYGVITYASGRPRALTRLPRQESADLAQNGMAIVCFIENAGCRREAEALASAVAGSRTVISEITRGFLGRLGRPQRYVIVIVPPRP